ncbi:MAG: DUF3131 domain-containing protein [Deltaproteobacteria bacterium]|nr:DUF3131 domain-containing protein [Deltaproteobacteria bacterium]
MSLFRYIFIIILIFFVSLTYAKDGIAQSIIPKYKTIMFLYKKSEYNQAAKKLEILAKEILKRGKGKKELKDAAFAYILATIAYEKDNNSKAYDTWAEGIKLYLAGKSRWEDEKKSLKKRLDKIISEINLAKLSGRTISLKKDDIFIVELDNTFKFSTYNGPKPGLKEKKKPSLITVSRDYYPRPLAVIREEEKVIAKKTKWEEGITKKEEATSSLENYTPLSRGFPVLQEKKEEPSYAKQGDIQPPIYSRSIIIYKPTTSTSIYPFKKMIKVQPKKRGKIIEETITPSTIFVTPPPSSLFTLNDSEMEIAKIAWQYFEANYQINTGLINSVHRYRYATLWDMASSLAGFIAAEKLGVIDSVAFYKKTKKFLETLKLMPLYNDELPNREYATNTGKMVDIKNRPSNKGSGWSAIDISRMLIWLRITKSWYPDFKKLIDEVIERWKFYRLVKDKELNGTFFNGIIEIIRQEGRFGYEQYAATGCLLWDLDVRAALDYDNISFTNIFGISIPYDKRSNAFLTSEPFFLSKIELNGIDEKYHDYINRIYKVQKKRWEIKDILTAVSEDSMDRPPWFTYNNIFLNNKSWVCVSHNGKPYPQLKNMSTKAAFAWWAIFEDEYSKKLKKRVEKLFHPTYGYYAGIYENGKINKSLNVNTNSIILESLLYIKRGKRSFLERPVLDKFKRGR